jgi:hypothetical protein
VQVSCLETSAGLQPWHSPCSLAWCPWRAVAIRSEGAGGHVEGHQEGELLAHQVVLAQSRWARSFLRHTGTKVTGSL